MKNIFSALVTGFILFGCHYIFAKVFYTKNDIIDLKESEVREVERHI